MNTHDDDGTEQGLVIASETLSSVAISRALALMGLQFVGDHHAF